MGRRDLERTGLGANDSNTANSNKNEKIRVLESKGLELEFAIFRSIPQSLLSKLLCFLVGG